MKTYTGKHCFIKPAMCQNKEEEKLEYIIVSEPKPSGKNAIVDIQPLKWDYDIKPTETISIEYLNIQ